MITLPAEVGIQLVRDIRDKLYAERQTMTQQEWYDRVRQNATRMLDEIEQIHRLNNNSISVPKVGTKENVMVE